MYFAAFAISSKNERDGYWPGIEGKMAMTCEEKITKETRGAFAQFANT